MSHNEINLLFQFGVHLLFGLLELVDILHQVIVIVVEDHLVALHHRLVLLGVTLVLEHARCLHLLLLGLWVLSDSFLGG